jgi:tripartite-type tricarboxylate transporter receptor subunit TctC
MLGMHVVAGLAGLLVLTVNAHAQGTYPDRPVKIIVPTAAGGGADALARLLAMRLGERTGGQFVVENRPGSGTIVGTRSVATADPDGYTLMMTQTSLTISQAINTNLPYNVIRDFQPIVNVALGPNGLAVHSSVPTQTLPEFIAYAKANSNKLSYSSAGVGTASHMGMELLKSMTGIDVVHVPTRGTGPAMIDLLGGQVQTMLGSLPVMLPEQRNGRIRLIATAERKRSPWTPDLPTVEEAGFPGFESGNWTGILGPAKLDPKIVAFINENVVAVLNTPDMKERLFAIGFEPIGNTPQEFAATIKRDIERWTEVAQRAGIRNQ